MKRMLLMLLTGIALVHYLKLVKIMKTLDDILALVAQERSVANSLIVLVKGMRLQLIDALNDADLSPANQEKVDKVFTNVETGMQEIAAAVVENTTPLPKEPPADEPPTEPVVP